MIVERVIRITSTKSDKIQSRLVSDLADEFPSERDPEDLVELLESGKVDLIGVALYILGEINIRRKSTLQKIIDQLFRLSDHENIEIRFQTLISLSSLTTNILSEDLNLIYKKMSQDSDESIRKTAIKLLNSGSFILDDE